MTEFNYRLAGRSEAHIFVGLRTTSRRDAHEVAEDLRQKGYPTLDLTDDETSSPTLEDFKSTYGIEVEYVEDIQTNEDFFATVAPVAAPPTATITSTARATSSPASSRRSLRPSRTSIARRRARFR